jgi:hypothetical protein
MPVVAAAALIKVAPLEQGVQAAGQMVLQQMPRHLMQQPTPAVAAVAAVLLSQVLLG